jgi:hypothetical protein
MIYLVELKKDQEAKQKMEALEYQYGVKVLNIFDKGNRFKFFQVVEDWHRVNEIIDAIFKRSLTT